MESVRTYWQYVSDGLNKTAKVKSEGEVRERSKAPLPPCNLSIYRHSKHIEGEVNDKMKMSLKMLQHMATNKTAFQEARNGVSSMSSYRFFQNNYRIFAG